MANSDMDVFEAHFEYNRAIIKTSPSLPFAPFEREECINRKAIKWCAESWSERMTRAVHPRFYPNQAYGYDKVPAMYIGEKTGRVRNLDGVRRLNRMSDSEVHQQFVSDTCVTQK